MKIYDLHMKSMGSSVCQTEPCGCGSAAEIAYMGHHLDVVNSSMCMKENLMKSY